MPTTRSATSAIAAGMPKTTRSTFPSSPMRPSIKRSSSIASLPTPPRTLHKRRGRGRSHASIEQEQEDDELPTLDAPSTSKAKVAEQPVVQARKRVRVAGASSALPTLDEDEGAEEDHVRTAAQDDDEDEAAAEDAFWLGQPGPSVPTVANNDDDDEDEAEDGNSPPALLDRPNRVKVQAPFSPPPSKHKHSVKSSQVKVKASATISLVAPVTPPPRPYRSSPRRVGPVRDSGNNPFLEEDHSLGSQPTLSPPNPTTPTPYVEPPTVTYVFRGARALMANHLYKAEAFQEERAKLPMEHPDYEPSELCPPKKLFVSEITQVRRLQPSRQAKMAPRTPSPTRVSRSPQRPVGGIASTPRRRHTPKTPGGELSKAFGPTRALQR